MGKISSHRNFGPKSAAWLESVGITTTEELFEIGVVEAYLKVKAAYPRKVSLNLLWAMQGALLDLPWNELPPEMKASLRQEVEVS